MFSIPKKTTDRIVSAIPRFQKILESAKARDINESDTVNIITDMLSEVFGFDKYNEVTSEFAIRGTYCDLAVKVGDRVQFMIEAKAIGLDLKDSHVRQAAGYGAGQGVPWVVLTNGHVWRLYRVKFEQPVGLDLVSVVDFLTINSRSGKDQEGLYLFCREGVEKDARGAYYERIQSFNRFVIAALVMSEPVTTALRRDLRRLSDGLRVDLSDIEVMLRSEVLKRELVDGDEAVSAQKRIAKLNRQSSKKRGKKTVQSVETGPEEASAIVTPTDKL